MSAFLWSVSGAAALVYWAMSLRDSVSWSRSVIKGLAVGSLVVVALIAGAPWVALALALCSLGDVCLSRPGENAFLAGLSAFALGHLAWIVIFIRLFGLDLNALFSGVRPFALVAMGCLGVYMLFMLLPRAGALKGPVAGYVAIIIAMGLTALSTPSLKLIAGAVLFMASDTLLGLQTFVLQKGAATERQANVLIWPLYWGAIVVLTLGVLG